MAKKNTAVIGCQWGDEGKGKIVDFLTHNADAVIRFQGGHNAGHTLIIEGKKFILHVLPSGCIQDGVACLIGNGVVVSLQHLLAEIDGLKARGYDVLPQLGISQQCSLLLPFHAALDLAREVKLNKNAIGTTGLGIGPAYEDKVARRGVRCIDCVDPKSLREKVHALADYHNFVLTHYFKGESIDADQVTDELLASYERLKNCFIDVPAKLELMRQQGKALVFEGAQGCALDIDHGTYPYVTSSNTVVATVGTGSGFSPTLLNSIIGVYKAYTTRVGSGPFPTELYDDAGDLLAKHGREFGSTTGRARRCGWFDLVMSRRAASINGLTELCITKLDVLDHLETIKVCVGYRYKGELLKEVGFDLNLLMESEPVYETFVGWMKSTQGVTSFEELPELAKRYLAFISKEMALPITMISTGPGREEMILVDIKAKATAI
jgi:adenylosuccinate synthase